MSAGNRPRQQRQAASQSQPIICEEESNRAPYPKRAAAVCQAPELDTCLEVVTEALSNRNRALLQHVFFIAENKFKYVSVGYYPARGYQPLAEFGGAKKLPLLLNAQQLQTMADNIAAQCYALSTNEHYKKTDGDFKMNKTGSYRVARVYLGKSYMTFTYDDLRNLAYIMYMIQYQMTFYIATMTEVMAYIDTAHDSATFVEPPSTADKSINYYQLRNSSLY
jgi:hypothetical protein